MLTLLWHTAAGSSADSAFTLYTAIHAVYITVGMIENVGSSLYFPHSGQFLRHCVLSDGTERCILLRNQSKEIKISQFPPIKFELQAIIVTTAIFRNTIGQN